MIRLMLTGLIGIAVTILGLIAFARNGALAPVLLKNRLKTTNAMITSRQNNQAHCRSSI